MSRTLFLASRGGIMDMGIPLIAEDARVPESAYMEWTCLGRNLRITRRLRRWSLMMYLVTIIAIWQ